MGVCGCNGTRTLQLNCRRTTTSGKDIPLKNLTHVTSMLPLPGRGNMPQAPCHRAFSGMILPRCIIFAKNSLTPFFSTKKRIGFRLSVFLSSLLSDSNQRPRDYKSRALANWAKEAGGQLTVSRRYNQVPLLCSHPGGFRGSWPYRTARKKYCLTINNLPLSCQKRVQRYEKVYS